MAAAAETFGHRPQSETRPTLSAVVPGAKTTTRSRVERAREARKARQLQIKILLRQAREQLGYSAAWCAERVGVDENTWQAYENPGRVNQIHAADLSLIPELEVAVGMALRAARGASEALPADERLLPLAAKAVGRLAELLEHGRITPDEFPDSRATGQVFVQVGQALIRAGSKP